MNYNTPNLNNLIQFAAQNGINIQGLWTDAQIQNRISNFLRVRDQLDQQVSQLNRTNFPQRQVSAGPSRPRPIQQRQSRPLPPPPQRQSPQRQSPRQGSYESPWMKQIFGISGRRQPSPTISPVNSRRRQELLDELEELGEDISQLTRVSDIELKDFIKYKRGDRY